MGLDSLSISEHIVTLLRIDSRESIEEAALETQRDGRSRLEDSVTCLLHVNFLDCLS